MEEGETRNESELRREEYAPPGIEVFDLRVVVVGSGTAFNDFTGDASPPGSLPGPG